MSGHSMQDAAVLPLAFRDASPKVCRPPVTFLYCGTLGLLHSTSTMFSYLHARKVPDGCRLEFRTSGAGKKQFEQAITSQFPSLLNDGTVSLGNALGDSDWRDKMVSSQVGMVFQDSGSEKVIFPSKVFSVLHCVCIPSGLKTG